MKKYFDMMHSTSNNSIHKDEDAEDSFWRNLTTFKPEDPQFHLNPHKCKLGHSGFEKEKGFKYPTTSSNLKNHGCEKEIKSVLVVDSTDQTFYLRSLRSNNKISIDDVQSKKHCKCKHFPSAGPNLVSQTANDKKMQTSHITQQTETHLLRGKIRQNTHHTKDISKAPKCTTLVYPTYKPNEMHGVWYTNFVYPKPLQLPDATTTFRKCTTSKCNGRKTKLDVDIQHLFSDRTTRKHMKDARKELQERTRRSNKAVVSSIKHRRKQEASLKKITASQTIYEIFRGDHVHKYRRRNAAVDIQRTVRGWHVRNQLKKCMSLVKGASKLREYIRNTYVPHLRRMMMKHSLDKPNVEVNFMELLKYIRDRNRYEAEFDLFSSGGAIPHEKVKEFLEKCDLNPTTSEILMVLHKIGQKGYQDLSKVKAIDMIFHLAYPSGLHFNIHTKPIPNTEDLSKNVDFQTCLDMIHTSRISKINHMPSVKMN